MSAQLTYAACDRKKRKREGAAEDKADEASKTEGTEEVEETKSVSVEDPQDGLTEAQRKHLKKLEERVRGHEREETNRVDLPQLK